MKTALLILLILGPMLFLRNRIWPGKEYKLWNKIATRKDKIMDLVFMAGMGIVLLGIFYVASKSFKKTDTPQVTEEAVSQTRRTQTAQKNNPAQNTNPPKRYTPPSYRP